MTDFQATDVPNLVLIGYRGTGKTTVAKHLAERLHRPWIDADDVVETRAGCSIAEIFASGGESVFRDWEQQVTSELMGRRGLIIASGGGVILRAENRAALVDAVVVWLTASPEILHDRIYADPSSRNRRPSLTDSSGLDEIRQVLAERTPLYQQVADYQLSSEFETPDAIADRIVSLLESGRR